ncbi:MAG: N-acetylmuramoyl-L-alanine amidase [bacterium]|nr:N-acetylmuramoyl-L-alanine amidase [bacterium]
MKKAVVIFYTISFSLFIIFVLLMFRVYSNLYKTADCSAKPDSNVTFVIDPGHGGEDGGAVANGITEKDINLQISMCLADIMRANGYKVNTIRDQDCSVESEGDTLRQRKVSDMKNRMNIYNSSENNVVISIHQNKFTDSKYYGTQIFYSPNNSESAVLAKRIKNQVKSLLQPDNSREIKKAGSDIYLLKNAETPSVIVECGFISNPEEAKKLTDKEYQKQLAWCIFQGTIDFLNENSYN